MTDAVPEWWYLGPSARERPSSCEDTMSESDTDISRLSAAQHAMQSGVAVEMNWNPQPTDPKHLRVGVNSAMCDHAALVRLLIGHGIITEDEYIHECALEMEREVARYTERANEHYGSTGVKLA